MSKKKSYMFIETIFSLTKWEKMCSLEIFFFLVDKETKVLLLSCAPKNLNAKVCGILYLI